MKRLKTKLPPPKTAKEQEERERARIGLRQLTQLSEVLASLAKQSVLSDAADYIVRNGWAQRQLELYPGGPACALGAILAVAPNRELFQAARELLRQRIRHSTGHEFDGYEKPSIPRWNNAPGRETYEVLSLMRGDA